MKFFKKKQEYIDIISYFEQIDDKVEFIVHIKEELKTDKTFRTNNTFINRDEESFEKIALNKVETHLGTFGNLLKIERYLLIHDPEFLNLVYKLKSNFEDIR